MKRTTCIILAVILTVFSSCQNNKNMIIAMAQIFCLDGDRSGNFRRIENAIIESKEQGADLVCFPETSILGWVNSDAHERAYPVPGKDSDRISQLAREYDVHICIGLAEKDGDRLHDSVILVDNEGNILLKHRKINILTELMTPPYTPGNTVQAVETDFGKIGLMICADSFLQDRVEEMKKLQPDLVLIPYGWAAPEGDWPEHAKELEDVVRNTATTVGCPVIGTDLVGEISKGPWTGQVYGGQSVAIDGEGNILAKGKDRDREVVMIDLRLEEKI